MDLLGLRLGRELLLSLAETASFSDDVEDVDDRRLRLPLLALSRDLKA